MNLQISSGAAADTLLRRRGIRSSLDDWCRFAGFEPALHHRLLNRKLEQVECGEIKNLAVFMPPGSAKSTYASVLFPPWALARNSDWPVIAASHTTELAEKWGRRVRGLISEHGLALGISLSETSQAAGRWALSAGGEYYAAGVGTAIAGFRAKLGLIDDPVRSREDADSEAMRERVWDWYVNDFRTRLMPGARKILIQTRWHEDDLAGRALQNEDWEVISLPALAGPGDILGRSDGAPLWTDGDYGYGAQLLDIRASVPPRTWSALYQQRPAPETGEFFKKEWFSFYDTPPPLETLHVYGASDYAVTAQGGDYTVHGVGGMDANGDLFILDLLGQLLDTMTEGSAPLAAKLRPRRDWFDSSYEEGPDEGEGVNWRVV